MKMLLSKTEAKFVSNSLNTKDKITSYIYNAIHALTIGNPIKTALGVLLGIVLQGVVDVIFQVANISLNVSLAFYISFGILLLHNKALFKRYNQDEYLETGIHYLTEVQRMGDFTEEEKREQWKKFVETIFKRISESSDGSDKEKTNNNKSEKMH